MKAAVQFILAILAGLFVAWLLQAIGEPPRTYADAYNASPLWQLVLKGLTMSLALSGPAFVAGFVANRYGWLVGAITSIMGQTFELLYVGSPLFIQYQDTFITYGIRSVVLSMLAAEAGQFLRHRWPPNNSSKPTPLRGAA